MRNISLIAWRPFQKSFRSYHPFRDGNGRTTRLLCDLLLMQAGFEPLKATAFYKDAFVKKYHQAIQEMWRTADTAKLINLLEPMISK